MGNMSYCRFSNTLNDLWECEEHFEDNDLSEEEFKSRKKIYLLCKAISENFDYIEHEEFKEDFEEGLEE